MTLTIRASAPTLLAAFVAVAAFLPDRAHAQMSCDKCEHICMWAPLLISAQKAKMLYESPDVRAESENRQKLEANVTKTLMNWSTKSDAETPCYKILYDEYLGGNDPSVILPETQTLNNVISKMPPSGNLLRVNPEKKGCPIEDPKGRPWAQAKKDLEEKLCPDFLNALYEHEVHHQKECQSLWANGSKKGGDAGGKKAAVAFYSDKNNFAQSEVNAYDKQIELMREAMQKLIDQKGCQVDSHSIEDFAPPPDEEQVKKAREKTKNLDQALKLIEQHNKSVADGGTK